MAILLNLTHATAFPCRLNKAPAFPHGFHNATADPPELRELWRRHPGPLVGVPTGEASGLDVLDIDGPRHPEAAEWWSAHRDRLPPTRIHRTRSGGVHVLFRHRPDIRCWTGRPGPGIDGRSSGGFIVWWPATGLPVESDAPLTGWPAWLLADLQPSSPVVRSESRVTIPDEYALAGLVRKVAGAAEGRETQLRFGRRAGLAKWRLPE
jgi:hypothetical protein